MSDQDERSKQTTETLLKVYEKNYDAWSRMLDIRFKLVGLVPLASAGGILSLLAKASEPYGSLWALGLMGAAITAGLWIYERRNGQLIVDHMIRGAEIEHQLGVSQGVFLGRRPPSGLIRHQIGIGTVYGATMLGWLTLLCR